MRISRVSESIQHNVKVIKEWYSLIRQVFGPQSTSVVLFKLMAEPSLWWHQGSQKTLLRFLSQYFSYLWICHPYFASKGYYQWDAGLLHCCRGRKNKVMNTEKTPGLDGIPIAIFLHGGVEDSLLISDMWLSAPVLQDWGDDILISE